MAQEPIGLAETAVVAFGLMQHLLQLLVKKEVITSAEVASLIGEVKQQLPSGNKFAALDQELGKLVDAANDAAKRQAQQSAKKDV